MGLEKIVDQMMILKKGNKRMEYDSKSYWKGGVSNSNLGASSLIGSVDLT